MVTSEHPASPSVELDEHNLAEYLRGRGVVDRSGDAVVRTLSGGYINNVFRVESAGHVYIVKQSFPAAQRTILRADIRRGLMEVAVMKAIKSLLGADAPIPTILDDDPDNYVSIMTPAPDEALLYDTELLAGRFHEGTGRRLGVYAARLHEATAGAPDIARDFRHNPGFALRDQSIRSAAGANPDLAPLIETMLRRNADEGRVLVDADITPKNVLVHDDGITKLDFECAQWGHPAFDVGIILAHFVLLGFARPASTAGLLTEGRGCYEGYASIREEARSAEFLSDVARYAGVMMLGRADGDLVFDYLVAHRLALRTLVAELATDVTSIDQLLGLAETTLARLSAAA
jgi:aminoglycoside phosphotransferase (APT) family kinase protein